MRIFRIFVLVALIIILLQIYLLPDQQPYIDLVMLKPVNQQWQISSSAEVDNNISVVYPFLRNVMGKITLIRLNYYGIEVSPSDYQFNNDNDQLSIDKNPTWSVLPNKPVKNEAFTSSWEIQPWTLYNVTASMKYLIIVLSIFENHKWDMYGWVSLLIKE